MAIPFLNGERLNNEVNFEKAEVHVRASLREGADLRLKVAGDCGRQIVEAALLISDCLAAGGKLLVFDNGGSGLMRSISPRNSLDALLLNEEAWRRSR